MSFKTPTMLSALLALSISTDGCSRSSSTARGCEGICADAATPDLASYLFPMPDMAQSGQPPDLSDPLDQESPADLTVSRSWVLVPSGTTENLTSMWGSGVNDIYAVGANGTIVHSTNGVVWQALASGTTNFLSGVSGTGPSNVYVVGTATILHSTDGGKTWLSEPDPVQESCCDVVAGLGHDVFAVAGSIVLHTTTTPGTPWTDIFPMGTYDFWSVLPLPSGRLLLGGEALGSRTIVYTDNLGQTSSVANMVAKNDRIFAMWAASDQEIYAVTAIGEILRSMDGAANWTTLVAKQNNTDFLYSVWGSSGTDIYAVGPSVFGVYHSSDHGMTWQNQPIPALPPNTKEIGGIWGYESTVYLVGDNGVILRLE